MSKSAGLPAGTLASVPGTPALASEMWLRGSPMHEVLRFLKGQLRLGGRKGQMEGFLLTKKLDQALIDFLGVTKVSVRIKPCEEHRKGWSGSCIFS